MITHRLNIQTGKEEPWELRPEKGSFLDLIVLCVVWVTRPVVVDGAVPIGSTC